MVECAHRVQGGDSLFFDPGESGQEGAKGLIVFQKDKPIEEVQLCRLLAALTTMGFPRAPICKYPDKSELTCPVAIGISPSEPSDIPAVKKV